MAQVFEPFADASSSEHQTAGAPCVAILSSVLHEARDAVAAHAAERSLAVTVVPAYGGVALDRPRIVELLARLLREAIYSAAAGDRVRSDST